MEKEDDFVPSSGQSKYLGVLKNGPKIPMVIVTESIENNIVVVASRTYPKDPTDYTPDEKEDASLDINCS